MRQKLLTICCVLACLPLWAQPRYDLSQTSREILDRGVVAVKQADGNVFISWRILESDKQHEAFDIYRNSKKLNDKPLSDGGAFFIDKSPLTGDAVYEIRGGGVNGEFTLCSDAPTGYLAIPLQKPDGGTVPVMQGQTNQPRQPRGRNRGSGMQWRDNGQFQYSANDATVADVDGDGQYEIILKWDPSNSRDNSHDGYTGSTLLDCYRLSGELLWRIDLGRNIRSGAHYVQFIAYDLDGDGRAELMVKTADGTRDGKGRTLLNGKFSLLPASDSSDAASSAGTADTIPDYRNPRGRILDGPEYITVFNGLTGEAMDTKAYLPERGNVSDWGDNRGNRSERYLAGVGYFGHKLNGMRVASAVFCRGYYTRSVIACWDWDGHKLSNRWTFDTNTPEWNSYAGQGNHNLRIADVDGDGYDEITYGSMAVDHDGTGLYNTGMGHGDAIHLLAMPSDGRLLIWDCHENRRDGSDLREASDGRVIFQIRSKSDVGRAMAADIDPTSYGVEMWSTDSHGIRDINGDVVGHATDAEDPQHNNQLILNGRWLSINFGIWWDGDLLRELLDHETVTKYDWKNRQIIDLQKFDGTFNNGTKSNPCLSADILGDWREEVVMRNRESTELRIYTTTIPTDYRINCLMQDIPYRLSVAYQNVGYNQPPETGFYLGPDRTDYLK